MSGNFRWEPPTSASYASQDLDTTNLPPQQVPGRATIRERRKGCPYQQDWPNTAACNPSRIAPVPVRSTTVNSTGRRAFRNSEDGWRTERTCASFEAAFHLKRKHSVPARAGFLVGCRTLRFFRVRFLMAFPTAGEQIEGTVQIELVERKAKIYPSHGRLVPLAGKGITV